MVCYVHDPYEILVECIKIRRKNELIWSFSTIHKYLVEHGFQPSIQFLDKKVPDGLKKIMVKENKFPIGASAPTPHQYIWKSYQNLEGALHIQSIHRWSELPVAYLRKFSYSRNHNTQSPMPIKQKSTTIGWMTSLRSLLLQPHSNFSPSHKIISVLNDNWPHNMESALLGRMICRPCPRSSPLLLLLHSQNHIRTDITHCGIFPQNNKIPFPSLMESGKTPHKTLYKPSKTLHLGRLFRP